MNELTIGQLVALSNDYGTFVEGVVDSTASFFRTVYEGATTQKVLTYTISLQGIGSEFRDHEWTIVEVTGPKA